MIFYHLHYFRSQNTSGVFKCKLWLQLCLLLFNMPFVRCIFHSIASIQYIWQVTQRSIHLSCVIADTFSCKVLTEFQGEIFRITCAVYSPTLSTPYLWPATWCVRGTHPFRWGAWPCGPRDLWMHFSIVGDAPEIRGVRLTPRSTGLGLISRRPRDSINTWRWVVDICRNRKQVGRGCRVFVQVLERKNK